MKDYITVIGGGLAGSEAAYQISKKGIPFFSGTDSIDSMIQMPGSPRLVQQTGVMPGRHGRNNILVHKDLPAWIPASETRKINTVFKFHCNPAGFLPFGQCPLPVLPQSDEAFFRIIHKDFFRSGKGGS